MWPTPINISLGFLEGFALIISPCILPILPLILAGSFTGSKQRPFGIITGFVIAFAVFTFFSRSLVAYWNIDLNIVRYVAYAILFLLGIIMLSSYLTQKFTVLTQRLANINTIANDTANDSFASGVLFGSLIAIIWTPCAGPILAAVIVQTVIQQTTLLSFLVILAFAAGAALPMLIIAFYGRNIMSKFGFFKSHANLLRKILGLIVIISVIYMMYFSNTATALTGSKKPPAQMTALYDGLATPYPAPAIAGIDNWINSQPLTLAQLKGKVVLIDFWTYSCINCIRTLPYLKDWYAKYHDKGLIIIGVHSPEFAFEKVLANVENAVKKDGIKYPVALDNQFVTWRNFHNSYWPAHYLIDKQHKVVYEHFGEGNYDETENNIRFLLGMTTQVAGHTNETLSFFALTPETYLGYAREENYAGTPRIIQDKTANYIFPSQLPESSWALQGPWTVLPDKITSNSAISAIKLKFYARKVYIVMGSTTSHPIKVKLLLNGEPLIQHKGHDVANSNVTVMGHKLYEIVVQPQTQEGILELFASAPGLEIYTFTFGG